MTQTLDDRFPPKPELRAIKGLSHQELVARMSVGIDHFDPRVCELDNESIDRAWLPDAGVGRWPIRVLLGHCADAEIVWAHRIRKIIAEDRPALALWDEHAFIDGGIYGCTEGSEIRPPIGGDLAMIHTTRAWGLALLNQLSDEQWERQGMHPDHGPISVRKICEYFCWHLEHHAWHLNAKVFAMLGPMPEAESCGDGGCGSSSCGCKS
jgi:hypothetical protein